MTSISEMSTIVNGYIYQREEESGLSLFPHPQQNRQKNNPLFICYPITTNEPLIIAFQATNCTLCFHALVTTRST